MVTMSTEVDTTQSTIATAMPNKMLATSTTTRNGTITEIQNTIQGNNNSINDMGISKGETQKSINDETAPTTPTQPTPPTATPSPLPRPPSHQTETEVEIDCEERSFCAKSITSTGRNKLNPQITITESESVESTRVSPITASSSETSAPECQQNEGQKEETIYTTNGTTVSEKCYKIESKNSAVSLEQISIVETTNIIHANPSVQNIVNTKATDNSSTITTATTNNNTEPTTNSNAINQNVSPTAMQQANKSNQSTQPLGAPSSIEPASIKGDISSSMTSSQLKKEQTSSHNKRSENAPNILVYKKMEAIIEKMQAENTGVSVRTVKGFMTKVPSVFTGADLISWILKNLDVEDVTEALHFAHLLASHGYIFPIDDHQLTVKNDGTFYRFQTPYFWPSNCWEPENTDYAVYLCKRTMQNKTRLELADYEAENLAKLQKMFSRKWEFIFMQAESQSKVAKKRDKLERKVLDSQERAFWDVHRPMPGCVNTTEIDIKKAYRRGCSSHGTGSAGAAVAKNPIVQLTRIINLRKQKLERRTIKVSKAAEAMVSYYEQYNEFDYFITSPELPNPWQTDSTEMWEAEKNSKEVSMRRVKRWAFSMRELLKDPVGREQFAKFLEKEYSYENLVFWEAVQDMKTLPQSEIKESILHAWNEFLAPDAPRAVNVDSKSVELAREAVNLPDGPNRWCFDVAAAHVYHLMERDSYPRYLRSEMYKEFVNSSRKKVKSIPNLFGVKR